MMIFEHDGRQGVYFYATKARRTILDVQPAQAPMLCLPDSDGWAALARIRVGDRKWLRFTPYKLHCAQNAGEGTGYGALYAVNSGPALTRHLGCGLRLHRPFGELWIGTHGIFLTLQQAI